MCRFLKKLCCCCCRRRQKDGESTTVKMVQNTEKLGKTKSSDSENSLPDVKQKDQPVRKVSPTKEKIEQTIVVKEREKVDDPVEVPRFSLPPYAGGRKYGTEEGAEEKEDCPDKTPCVSLSAPDTPNYIPLDVEISSSDELIKFKKRPPPPPWLRLDKEMVPPHKPEPRIRRKRRRRRPPSPPPEPKESTSPSPFRKVEPCLQRYYSENRYSIPKIYRPPLLDPYEDYWKNNKLTVMGPVKFDEGCIRLSHPATRDYLGSDSSSDDDLPSILDYPPPIPCSSIGKGIVWTPLPHSPSPETKRYQALKKKVEFKMEIAIKGRAKIRPPVAPCKIQYPTTRVVQPNKRSVISNVGNKSGKSSYRVVKGFGQNASHPEGDGETSPQGSKRASEKSSHLAKHDDGEPSHAENKDCTCKYGECETCPAQCSDQYACSLKNKYQMSLVRPPFAQYGDIPSNSSQCDVNERNYDFNQNTVNESSNNNYKSGNHHVCKSGYSRLKPIKEESSRFEQSNSPMNHFSTDSPLKSSKVMDQKPHTTFNRSSVQRKPTFRPNMNERKTTAPLSSLEPSQMSKNGPQTLPVRKSSGALQKTDSILRSPGRDSVNSGSRVSFSKIQERRKSFTPERPVLNPKQPSSQRKLKVKRVTKFKSH